MKKKQMINYEFKVKKCIEIYIKIYKSNKII
jgi:hypothetical protein